MMLTDKCLAITAAIVLIYGMGFTGNTPHTGDDMTSSSGSGHHQTMEGTP